MPIGAHDQKDIIMYMIIRFYQDVDPEIIRRGLTLEEAQTHCRLASTHGDGWFDGYEDDGPV